MAPAISLQDVAKVGATARAKSSCEAAIESCWLPTAALCKAGTGMPRKGQPAAMSTVMFSAGVAARMTASA
jgi:hypothetical protein